MKKLFVLSLLTIIALSNISYAAPQTPQQFIDFVKSTKPLQIADIINRLANWLFGLLILLAGLFIMWAAYKYLTAGADPESAKEAKKIIIYAIIAIVIAALSRGIVYIVLRLVGVPIIIEI